MFLVKNNMNNSANYQMSESNFESAPPKDGAIDSAHAVTAEAILVALKSSEHGLGHNEALARIKQYGLNTMPEPEMPGVFSFFLRQFASPLIYVLVIATIFSLFIQEWADAIFIGAVLLVNAIMGTIQEYSAQKAAAALNQLVTTICHVVRESDTYEIDAKDLVPGDIVMLESGDRVPADLRLIRSHDLEVDESLLTGESLAVEKDANLVLSEDCTLGDKVTMAFAGTMINRGRGTGVVVGTAMNTELGQIASAVLNKPHPKAPLMIRMEKFTYKVTVLVAAGATIMACVAYARGMEVSEIFMLAVALAVSAIPEGLPVALTVALAISMHRMAKRHVIVRNLVAVEALGSCTYIATDKTGTLTVNQLTAKLIVFPSEVPWEVGGDSLVPGGQITKLNSQLSPQELSLADQLCQTAVLANEGFLAHRDGHWSHHGDAVDVALLVMAHKLNMVRSEQLNSMPEIATIPFESKQQLSASLNMVNGIHCAFVKGALERLLPLCNRMAKVDGPAAIDRNLLEQQADSLARQGYRVIALASGSVSYTGADFSVEQLSGLTLIGLVGMIDPLRDETKQAFDACDAAGVDIAMVTGDHPVTALAVSKELKLADSSEQIVTGPQLKNATNDVEFDKLTRDARVFARVEPEQKILIVQSLQRNGHYVAVSGDGANDAPALRAAHVGVAMGEKGTDVAREAAELVITDDNFASIVAGIEEGRVAYSNVRKVIFLLISTGVAELVMFTLALIANIPIPLLAVQLLWLNLVTNGIQDVALAFEPAEGNELASPPRKPTEAIFNRIMIERVVISAVCIGCMAFFLFQSLINSGMAVDEARNSTLLLMVLFENVHVFNCRSESRSVFRHNLMLNPLLLFGTITAQLIHIASMYIPWLKDVLKVHPVSLEHWGSLLMMALSILLVMEVHKLFRRKCPFR